LLSHEKLMETFRSIVDSRQSWIRNPCEPFLARVHQGKASGAESSSNQKLRDPQWRLHLTFEKMLSLVGFFFWSEA
jgi:hypothetical protein